MAEIDVQKREQYNQSYHQLIEGQQTLILSTVSVDGDPNCSYAPYIKDQQGHFYIFVSALATHTANMLQNKKASVLFIKPEQESQNLFARERVVLDCDIVEIARQEAQYENLLDKMQEKFGETVNLLKSLPDFYLLELISIKGKFVMGFGQAFDINVQDQTIRF